MSDVTSIRNMDELYARMIEDIDRATSEVLVEMYQILGGAAAQRFKKAWLAAAARGVDVRVLYDAVGSLETSDAYWNELRKGGCSVRSFNPIRPWRERWHEKRKRRSTLFRRNHRKFILIDQAVLYVGGANIGDAWLSRDDGGEDWKDACLRVANTGTASDIFARARLIFLDSWMDLTLREKSIVRDMFKMNRQSPTSRLTLLASRSLLTRPLRYHYLARIRKAKHYIYVTNPYFLPSRRLRRELVRAAKRGVKVVVLGAGKSDVAIVKWLSYLDYDRLMRHGVEVYEWYRSVLHSKAIISDDKWFSIGSFNFDSLSWRSNLELAIGVLDRQMAIDEARSFERDLRASRKLTRPGATFWGKIQVWCCYLLSPLRPLL